MRFVLIINTCVLLPSSSLLLYPIAKRKYCSALYHSKWEKNIHSQDRFTFMSSLSKMVLIGGVGMPRSTSASNIPKSNGANLSKVGTLEMLLPLVQLRYILLECATIVDNAGESLIAGNTQKKEVVTKLSALLELIPQEESKLKKLFDEYSDTVSYKQRYLDQNAFLVYYTRGFDGPSRPTIEETNDNDKQALQYGTRNDVWVSLEDIISTLKYYSLNTINPNDEKEALQDMKVSFHRAILAMDSYLDLVPQEQLGEAQKLILTQTSK